MEDVSTKKILKVDKSIDNFCISKSSNVQSAIQAFSKNKGLPLIVINEHQELAGSLSNGDIRKFLSQKDSNLTDPVTKALNKSPHYAFTTDDKSVIEVELSTEETRIIPIIDKNRKVISVAYFTSISITIGENNISYKDPNVYLIAEIGVNHNGNIEEAYELVNSAAEAGFNAIKLQFRSEDTYSNNKLSGDIDLSTEYILNELERTNLSIQDESDLCNHIKEVGLHLIGTPFDDEALGRMINYKPMAIKIASCDLTNSLLLRACANKGLPLILSTGMSNETEIINTKRYLEKLDVEFAFLHCNSTYPSPIEDVRLRYISRLAEITEKVVGYSSHDGNQIVPISAISAGARIIEVHITKDKSANGTDHSSSIETIELKGFVKSARSIGLALGEAKPRVPTQGEIINRVTLGKSLCYKTNIKKGKIINEHEDLILRSPGDGLPASSIEEINGIQIQKEVNRLDQVKLSDFSSQERNSKLLNNKCISKRARKVLNKFSWGVPVRYRDIENMINKFDPPLIEIHLSSKDINYDIKRLNKEIILNRKILIHAIEQYHDGFILDLASDSKEIREESIERLGELSEHCESLQRYLCYQKPFEVILNCGGFSKDGFLNRSQIDKKEDLLIESLNKCSNKFDGIIFLPQTMPPYPWHQGGRSYHNLLRSTKSIKRVNKNTGLLFCLDFSHTFMESKYQEINFNKEFKELINISGHLHISDSSSVSNEGLNIDEGSIDFAYIFNLLNQISSHKEKISFIPEIWQGHHNDGEGFEIALQRIASYIENEEMNYRVT